MVLITKRNSTSISKILIVLFGIGSLALNFTEFEFLSTSCQCSEALLCLNVNLDCQCIVS